MTGTSAGTSLRVALLSFPKSGRTWLKLMLKFYLEIMYIDRLLQVSIIQIYR